MLGRTLTISGLLFIGLVNFGPHHQKTAAYKAPQITLKPSNVPSTTPKPTIVPVAPAQPTLVPASQAPAKKLYSTGVEQWRPLVQQYFGAETNYALAVMMCESGGNTYATGHNSNGSTDRGLLQLNSIHAAKVGGNLNAFYDPETNIRVGKIIRNGSGWGAWSCSKKI